jgi:hypothetical protein
VASRAEPSVHLQSVASSAPTERTRITPPYRALAHDDRPVREGLGCDVERKHIEWQSGRARQVLACSKGRVRPIAKARNPRAPFVAPLENRFGRRSRNGRGQGGGGARRRSVLAGREDGGGTGNDGVGNSRKPLEPDCAAHRPSRTVGPTQTTTCSLIHCRGRLVGASDRRAVPASGWNADALTCGCFGSHVLLCWRHESSWPAASRLCLVRRVRCLHHAGHP